MWIIGDIHGCLLELDSLLRRIPQADPLLFLGDYIDRGPSSAGVISRVLREQHRSVFLMGNHESMMVNYFADPSSEEGRSWLHPLNGGKATLASYGMPPGSRRDALPEAHRAFLESLQLYYEGDTFIAVHAGLDVHEPALASQDRETMLWIRNGWIQKESTWKGKHVFYGHTPARYVNGPGRETELIAGRKSTGLDTGCVYGGCLTAVNTATGEVLQVKAERNYWDP